MLAFETFKCATHSAAQDLYGKTLNFVTFKHAINTLDKWYHDRGILGQVADALQRRFYSWKTCFQPADLRIRTCFQPADLTACEWACIFGPACSALRLQAVHAHSHDARLPSMGLHL